MGVVRRFLAAKTLIRPGVGEPAAEDDEQWYRWYRRFHYGFSVLALMGILGAQVESGVPRELGITGSIITLFLVGWFWLRGSWERIQTNGDAILYFAVLLPLLGVAIRMYNGFGLLIFAAFWQGFVYFRIMPAMIYGLFLTLVITFAFSDATLDDLGDLSIHPGAIFAGTIGLLFAGMMALYIEGIGREADRRQRLLVELREAQDALTQREREAGIQEERRRLAGEIHDTIAQQFTSILTNLEAAETRYGVAQDAARNHVQAARDAARQGIQDARAMLHALQPHVLEGRSLTDALRQIAEEADALAGASVRFREEGNPAALDRVQDAVLVRALQEALQNARKHAGASQIDVRLSWLDDEVLLDIEDDGQGFDVESVPLARDGHHLGLSSMKSRVEHAGGTWMIDSTPGEGTSLAISFPLDRTSEGSNGVTE